MGHAPEFEQRVRQQLAELDQTGMMRRLQVSQGVSFSSNDYLGLARHPAVVSRMVQATKLRGCGSTGSRLLAGQHESFPNLERRFAHWKGTETALFLSSGYLANLAVLSTFFAPADVVFSDELNHASLIDGLRLSKAQKVIYPHTDIEQLARAIARYDGLGQRFLLTESIFSMDGDEAPLAGYAALCRATDTALIVDEAHAVGIRGANGSGLIEETGIGADVLLSINPAGKALGVGGALVVGPVWAIDFLIQRARPFIFSTAPPPAMADALDASLDVIKHEPKRRSRLRELSLRLRGLLSEHGINIGSGSSQIVPVMIGDTRHTVQVAELLQAHGYDVRAIRPPSVPNGTSRLRLSVNFNHDEQMLEHFCLLLAESIDRSMGVAA